MIKIIILHKPICNANLLAMIQLMFDSPEENSNDPFLVSNKVGDIWILDHLHAEPFYILRFAHLDGLFS